MIRDICKDEAFLAQKSQPATLDDLSVGQDLLDTLAHHKEECVGMAANMIGANNAALDCSASSSSTTRASTR